MSVICFMICRAGQLFDLICLKTGSIELEGAILQNESQEVLLSAPLGQQDWFFRLDF